MPRRMTQEEFIKKSKEIHENKYDYSLVNYINAKTNITIICSMHGEFEQLPSQHLKGRGCQECGGSKRMTQEEFIKKSKEIHENKYDYSLVNYKNNNTKIKLICSTHGEFETLPSKHIHRKFGCPKCGIKRRVNKKRNNINDIIERFKEIHGDKYNYSKFNYFNFSTSSIIICTKHGEFLQNAYNHLKGCGCPKCGNLISNSEVEIVSFIKELGFDILNNKRNIIPPMELDIYIPDKKIAIEYHGLYWHSEKKLELRGTNPKTYHLNKLNLCNQKDIRLIQIFEDEWLYKKEIVINRLRHILGFYDRKIGGRQTIIKEIDTKIKNEFLENHHIQGSDSSSIKLGAFYNNELISVMTFGNTRIALGNKTNGFELIRFATKFGILGQGIASKLLHYFIKNYNSKSIITYSDKRWNTGNLYKQLGFNFSHTSYPNYWYIEKNKRLHRYNFRKQVLSKKLSSFDESKTEYENMLINGYDRIWDCGNDKWEMNM